MKDVMLEILNVENLIDELFNEVVIKIWNGLRVIKATPDTTDFKLITNFSSTVNEVIGRSLK